MKKKKSTYDILASNIEKIATPSELKEMKNNFTDLCDLNEFREKNKNIQPMIEGTDLFVIYKQELQKKINRLKNVMKKMKNK